MTSKHSRGGKAGRKIAKRKLIRSRWARRLLSGYAGKSCRVYWNKTERLSGKVLKVGKDGSLIVQLDAKGEREFKTSEEGSGHICILGSGGSLAGYTSGVKKGMVKIGDKSAVMFKPSSDRAMYFEAKGSLEREVGRVESATGPSLSLEADEIPNGERVAPEKRKPPLFVCTHGEGQYGRLWRSVELQQGTVGANHVVVEVDPGEGSIEGVAGVLGAISDVYRACGGTGLEIVTAKLGWSGEKQRTRFRFELQPMAGECLR